MGGQLRDLTRLTGQYREFREAGFAGCRGNVIGTAVEVEALQPGLDGDFPDAGRAEIDLILAPAQGIAQIVRQAFRLIQRPEKHMRIKKNAHSALTGA